MFHFRAMLIILVSLSSILLQAEEQQPNSLPNNGQDFTRPINRFDLRLEYQAGAQSVFGNALIATARSDLEITLRNNWEIGISAELPYEYFECPCSCKKNGGTTASRAGDSFIQTLVITPPLGAWKYGAGVKCIFPTAGSNLEIGDGKYQLLPSWGFRYSFTGWNPGDYIGLLLRHAFDVGGYSSAPHISKTYIQPSLNFNLQENVFLLFSPELIYNWKIQKWFIPFDVMLGVTIQKKFIFSVEYDCAIVNNFPQYRQEVEFRIGFFL